MTQPDLEAIERLFSDFAFCADHGDAEGLAHLFTEEGVLSIGNRRSEGRTRIAEDCEVRFAIPNRKTRHAWSNLRVTSLTPDTASTTALQLTFESLGNDKPAQLRVNDVFDQLCKDTSGVWRFSHRQIRCEMAVNFKD
ncbi:nuclear transport factor 2 family protein [Burkholderia sp. MR1-5-21]